MNFCLPAVYQSKLQFVVRCPYDVPKHFSQVNSPIWKQLNAFL